MKKAKVTKSRMPSDDPILTVEELNKFEAFKNLSEDKKRELISFVYCFALALYQSHTNQDEKQH